jgi:hypothetical protein
MSRRVVAGETIRRTATANERARSKDQLSTDLRVQGPSHSVDTYGAWLSNRLPMKRMRSCKRSFGRIERRRRTPSLALTIVRVLKMYLVMRTWRTHDTSVEVGLCKGELCQQPDVANVANNGARFLCVLPSALSWGWAHKLEEDKQHGQRKAGMGGRTFWFHSLRPSTYANVNVLPARGGCK